MPNRIFGLWPLPENPLIKPPMDEHLRTAYCREGTEKTAINMNGIGRPHLSTIITSFRRSAQESATRGSRALVPSSCCASHHTWRRYLQSHTLSLFASHSGLIPISSRCLEHLLNSVTRPRPSHTTIILLSSLGKENHLQNLSQYQKRRGKERLESERESQTVCHSQ